VFFPVFWTIYIPIVTIMLGAAGERLIHALRQLPRASAACLFEPAASAVLRSMIVARWRRCANHLPPVNGISQRPCRKFSHPPAISPKRVLLMQLMCRLEPADPSRSQLLGA